MDLNMAEIIKNGLIDSFIFIFNIPVTIGTLNTPLWILLLGLLFLIVIGKYFKRFRL